MSPNTPKTNTSQQGTPTEAYVCNGRREDGWLEEEETEETIWITAVRLYLSKIDLDEGIPQINYKGSLNITKPICQNLTMNDQVII